jgi:hypothetical protein
MTDTSHFKLNAQIVAQLKNFAGNLPAATIVVFAAVVGYYLGYFFWFAGFSVPPIDTQDLSLSSIALLGLVLLAFNFWTSFDIISKQPGVWKLVTTLVAFGAYLTTALFELKGAGFDYHKVDFWVATSRSIYISIAFLIFFLVFLFKRRSATFGIQEASILMLLGVLFIFDFGFQAFVTDLKQSKYSSVTTNGVSREFYVLRVMSSNIVAFNHVGCQFLLISRAATSSIEFKKLSNSDLTRKSVFDCVFQ